MPDPIDAGRPRVFCPLCGAVEYCDVGPARRYEHPPTGARKILSRRHTSCQGVLEYRAGVAMRRPVVGQIEEEPHA